jgi:hypothetical protein
MYMLGAGTGARERGTFAPGGQAPEGVTMGQPLWEVVDMTTTQLPPAAEQRGPGAPPPSHRRSYIVALVAVLALLAGGLVTVTLRAGDDREPAATTTPAAVPTTAGATTTVPAGVAPTTASPATSTPTTVAPRPPVPGLSVAATSDGSLLVRRGDDELEVAGVDRYVRVALAGGSTVVVEANSDSGASRLEQVTLRAGEIGVSFGDTLADEGRFPILSPNGRKLAYSAGAATASSLVVLDLVTNAERRWRFPDGHELRPLSWAADNVRISLEDSLAGNARTLVFDTSRAAGAVASHAAIGGAYHLATFRGALGTLVAAEGPTRGTSTDRVLEVHATTGQVRRVLLTTPFVIGAIDVDVSGEHLLIVSEDEVLYEWSGGALRRRSTGIRDAEW